MKKFLPENFIRLASVSPFPLLVVGGSVRDFLCGTLKPNADWDIAGAGSDEELVSCAEELGFTVDAVYKNTGTVRLSDPLGVKYEFTRFRSDKYVRGLHAPAEIEFTTDIHKDAVRRDFTANAVYFDAVAEKFIDPLGGIPDIEKRIFRTVAPAEKVFGEDGLRLMRLARLAAETGFSPDEECLAGARKHASLIRDIVPERIFTELTRLLNTDGAYRGLCILKDTGVLKEIMPELALGDGLYQRADFHKYDVLEHSFRCVRYAEKDIRFAALLHDVGKPFCYYRDGNFYDHPEEGARIAGEILTRLKAPVKLVAETKKLVSLHMRDFNLLMRENKVRRTIAENYALLPRLLALFQADFSACKDDLSPAPAAVKWQRISEKMKSEGAPRSLKELKINGNDLIAIGVKPEKIGHALNELLLFAIEDGSRNHRDTLLKRAEKFYT
ncbi:MAG: CCA tRNA nucleotidyltransferase [Clostridia bacterium]|nr:CCA tRNA nucleotidyltransferase [Clostridia bacterium]